MKVSLPSTVDASRLAALLLRQTFPMFSVVAPCQPGAPPGSVLHATFTAGSLLPPRHPRATYIP